MFLFKCILQPYSHTKHLKRPISLLLSFPVQRRLRCSFSAYCQLSGQRNTHFCGCKGTHIILHTQHSSPLFYDYLTILQRFTTVRHTPSPNNNLLSADDVDTTRQSFEGCCLSTYHLAQHGIHIERLPADQQIVEKDSTCTVERMQGQSYMSKYFIEKSSL